MVRRFSIRSLIALTALIAVAVSFTPRAMDAAKVIDFTGGRNSICNLHGVRMAKQLVGMKHGMPRFSVDEGFDPAKYEKVLKYPHTDEPVETGPCIPTTQELARVYVCSACVAARDSMTMAGN